MKKILVTGGAGYIGSHTVIELFKAGYRPIILDNFSNSSIKVIEKINEIIGDTIEFFEVDLLNIEDVRQAFKSHEFSGVIHFAGLKAVGESVEIPLKYYKENILSTINLCEIMSEFHVKDLVFSSSATVYGPENKMPIVEESILKASNPYGRTKLFIEEILTDLYTSDDSWKITLLRYFNPVGAHESGLIGENPKNIPNNLMPYITNVAIGKLDKLKIFGSDYPTKDGTGVRDYLHVVDLAKGHLKALQKNDKLGVKTYNMGTGNGYSVLDVVKTFADVNDILIPYELVERRPGDLDICFADTSKANAELDWQAEKSLTDMCRDSWKWQTKNPNGIN